jgi:DNA polymerase (family 10)
MPVLNAEIADAFREIADLLEIEGANEFRVRAYRNAARTIEELPRSARDMVAQGEDLSELPDIGEDLAGKIEELVETGGLKMLQEIRQRTPADLREMLDIAGLGPKRVQRLYQELGVTSLNELRDAAERDEIASLHGFGEKTQAKILEDLRQQQEEETRTRLDRAEQVVTPLVAYLEGLDGEAGVQRVDVAGSYRRRKETVGDLDILAISDAGEAAVEAFVNYEDVETVVSQGETRSTVVLRSGMQVDLRVVPQESYGAALLYFTGSKAHNIHLRDMALDRGLKVNEYGVFEGETRRAGEREAEIYDLFDLPTFPPELREDRGEFEAAQEGRLPDLVTLEAIRGDLQMHTTASDGKASLQEMVAAARERGYAYIAVTDHSPHMGVTQGLDVEEVERRRDEIAELNAGFDDGFRVLMGMEVDILEDGDLDLPDDVLAKLDVCLVAVHTHFDLSREAQTERILRALDHPPVHILAHPTGRRINERPPYAVDLDRVMEGALARGCFLEINANPERLDVDAVHARRAKEMGLKLTLSTDAHSVNSLGYMRFGIDQARRGWLTAEDVVNTRPWEQLKDLLRR